MGKTNLGLVEYAKAQLGKPYWMGTFGQYASAWLYEYNKKRLPQYYTASDFPSQFGQKVHDCIGLVKGYLWSDFPEDSPQYNAAQDVDADTMSELCVEGGNINTIPDIPGLLVFSPGHVGVYIGGGKVVEAMGHKWGVVETAVRERTWRTWGKCPWIEYVSAGDEKPVVIKQNVAVTYRDISVVLNGKTLELRNAAGQEIEPFIVDTNSSVYLPLRAIAEALNLNVEWTPESNTVTLTSK